VVVLPNVLRMDDEEADALREFVRGGGCLYASGWTSLTETRGVRRDDFMLADVFGCSADGDEAGYALFAKPTDPQLASICAPQVYVSVMPAMEGMTISGGPVRALMLRITTGSTLATLTLPFGHPQPGTVRDRNWSSIHSWPPHTDTDRPVLVSNRFGAGTSIYSAFDLESTDAVVNERLYTGTIKRLLGPRPSWAADAHPSVWVTVFDQPERGRMIVSFVNYQADLPPASVEGVRFSLRQPEGSSFSSLELAPDATPVSYRVEEGYLAATLDRLEEFAMVVASYEPQL
jgi:hypothetical protein